MYTPDIKVKEFRKVKKNNLYIIFIIPVFVVIYKFFFDVESISVFFDWLFPSSIALYSIYNYFLEKKKIEKLEGNSFQITLSDFICIKKYKKQIFNNNNPPKSMERNYESLVLTNEKGDEFRYKFEDYDIKEEELELLKQKFDKLKNYLYFRTKTNKQ